VDVDNPRRQLRVSRIKLTRTSVRWDSVHEPREKRLRGETGSRRYIVRAGLLRHPNARVLKLELRRELADREVHKLEA